MVGSVRGVFSGSLNLLYMAINFGYKPVTKPGTTSVNNKPNIVEVLTQYFEYFRDTICLIISQIYLSCTQFKMLTRATQYFESRKGKVFWNCQINVYTIPYFFESQCWKCNNVNAFELHL